VEYFSYLDIAIINCAKRTSKIKSRIYKAKAAFNKKKYLFYEQFLLQLMEETSKRYSWSVSVYDVELRKKQIRKF